MPHRFGLGSFRHVFAEESVERPLSTYLWGRVSIEPHLRSLGTRVVDDDPRALAAELAEQVANEAVNPVRVVDLVRGEWQEADDSNYRFAADSSVPSSPHLWIAAQVDGDVGMLTCFPDTARTRGVIPLAHRPTPGVADGYHQHAYWILPSRYDQSPFGADSGPFVWTDVILPREVYDNLEATSVDARPSRMLPQHFLDRLNVLLDDAHHTIEQWRRDLPDALLPEIEAARQAAQRRGAAREGLEFLPTWRPQAPRVTVDAPPESQDGDPTEATSALPTQRLSGSSFADFLAVTRKWAEAITRSPRSFATLPEEDLSALLAATLNGTFPFAGQEVFSYSGRTDIYVRADRLDGSLPEKVFVLENHWWDGQELLHRKLGQLVGYCTVRDTETVLMAMIRDRAELPDVGAALAAHPDVLPRPRSDDVCGYPTYDVTAGARRLRVALVTLDLRTI